MKNKDTSKKSLNIPLDIDYTKYEGASGLATSKWGPHAWFFLFSSIHGAYPVKLDLSNKEHVLIKKHFKQLFQNLQYVMPCIFCRNSFKIFLKELPIDPFMSGRIQMMYWLYLIRDKVNQKLIRQEKICYNNEKKILKNKCYNNEMSKEEYYNMVSDFKNKTFLTQPSPPFIDILERFEKTRGVCSKKAKTCLIEKKD